MSRVVLDASALLAMLRDEPGADRVEAVLEGALMSVVNVAEVVSHFAKAGVARDAIESVLRPLPVRLIPADDRLSYEAGMLRVVTMEAGLSLGDRYCLALAKREKVAALTAERRWPDIAQGAGVTVELIR
jgi:PIN domain nuclease of toxin-antitoxin system